MAWQAVPDGVVVTVRLTPKGGRDALEGAERMADGRLVLKARVRAAAHEGAANDALSRHLDTVLNDSRVQLADDLGTVPLSEILNQRGHEIADRRRLLADDVLHQLIGEG